MLFKKLLTVVLSVSVAFTGILSAGNTGSQSPVIAYAKDNIRFYGGDYYGEQFYGKKVKISSLKLPVGFSCRISTSDRSTTGSMTASDKDAVSLTELHDYQQWTVTLLKDTETALQYHRGLFQSGRLPVSALPRLELQAVRKSAKASDGKVILNFKYKNHTDSDITIEGIDTNWCQLSFGKEKPSDDREIQKPDWTVRKITIPAGKSKTVRIEKKTKKTGRLTYYDYPKLYFQYKGIHIHAYVSGREFVTGGDYYGTTSFADFLK